MTRATPCTTIARRETALVYLAIAGAHGVRLCDLARALRVHPRTVRLDMRALGVPVTGETSRRRAVLR